MGSSVKRLQILVVSQYYPPEPALYPSSIAEHLAAQGHRVRVLTTFPNYPHGRIYEGYRQRWSDKSEDGGVQILRKPVFPDHSQSAVRRILNYLSFALCSATEPDYARGADVIYVYATQLTAAFGPWLWRLFGGAPYVLHIQDLWPDSITGSSIAGGSRAKRLIEALLNPWIRSVYRHSSAIIGIAPTMAQTLVKRGVPASKALVIYNWATESVNTRPTDYKTEGRTRLLYAGNLGDMQDLETVLHAVHRANDAGVVLTLVGDGVELESLKRLTQDLAATNIRFVGRVSRDRMASYYAEADYSLVTLKDIPAFRGTIPSKLQASLLHGVPIISTVAGDVAALIDHYKIGVTAEPEDIRSLEVAVRIAAGHTAHEHHLMSQRATQVHAELFASDIGHAKVEDVLIRCGSESS